MLKDLNFGTHLRDPCSSSCRHLARQAGYEIKEIDAKFKTSKKLGNMIKKIQEQLKPQGTASTSSNTPGSATGTLGQVGMVLGTSIVYKLGDAVTNATIGGGKTDAKAQPDATDSKPRRNGSKPKVIDDGTEGKAGIPLAQGQDQAKSGATNSKPRRTSSRGSKTKVIDDGTEEKVAASPQASPAPVPAASTPAASAPAAPQAPATQVPKVPTGPPAQALPTKVPAVSGAAQTPKVPIVPTNVPANPKTPGPKPKTGRK